jgi:hypothetical protein
MSQGVYHIGNNRVLGYDEIDGELKPNKDAWIVKTIFELFFFECECCVFVDQFFHNQFSLHHS